MIQKYGEIHASILKINSEINEQAVHVQKIWGTGKTVCLSLRIPGKTLFLYLGRGNGIEGLWSHCKKPDSSIRLNDKFVNYLRRHVSNTVLTNISIDSDDRIVCMDFFKNKKATKLFYFWKGRESYFAFFEGDIAITSWRGKIETSNIDFSLFDEIGRKNIENKKFEKKELKKIDNVLESEEKLANSDLTHKKFVNKKNTKIKKILIDLEKCKQWKKLQQSVDGLNFDFSNKDSILINNYKFKLNRYNNHYKNRDIVYNKIKGLKKGEQILEKRLEDTKVMQSEKISNDYRSKVKKIFPKWNIEKNQAIKEVVTENDYALYTCENFKIGIGKNSNGNDWLRSKWAAKEDMWVHLEGHKSSHAIIKSTSEIPIDFYILIASAIRDFSKSEILSIPIMFTQVKNLKGVKGKKGSVLPKKSKYLDLIYDPAWESKMTTY